MQDLASEFSNIFRYPRTLTVGGGIPSRTQHLARPLAGRGAQAPRCPRCWDPNLGPFNFSAVVAPLGWGGRPKSSRSCFRPSVQLGRLHRHFQREMGRPNPRAFSSGNVINDRCCV